MDLARAIMQVRRRDRSAAPPVETAVVQRAPSGGTVPINATGTVEVAQCPPAVSPAEGDVVAIVRSAGAPIVLAILKVASSDRPDLGPLPPDDLAAAGLSYFPALYTFTWERDTPEGTYPNEVRFTGITDVQQGDSYPAPLPTRHGYWFHNWTLTSALAGATVDSARIRLPRSLGGPASANVTLTLRDVATQWPSGIGDTWPTYGDAPAEPQAGGTGITLLSASIGRGGATWTDLPPDLVHWMTTGQVGPGVYVPPACLGIVGPDNVTLQGVGSDPQSGLIEVRWHR